jgi:hypothetical protein
MIHMHYLPLAPGFFAILVGFFIVVMMASIVRGGTKFATAVDIPAS